jgi:glucose/arabinose dehydrogenase
MWRTLFPYDRPEFGRLRRRRLLIEPLEQRSLLATLPAGFAETPVATGLSNPTAMEFSLDGSDLWVLEQGGLVKRFAAGSTTADVVGNLSALGLSSQGERGVLGIAFDPFYETTKQVFIDYTATSPTTHNRVSRFTVNDSDPSDYYFVGASTAGPDAGASGRPTETVIFDLDPLSTATNHNGGAIHFGTDGELYIATGDNANSANSQSLGTLLGKILRINPDGSIPDQNPFVDSTSGKNQAIWALGLRNPFKFAFNADASRMFINDVGQNSWEEIDEGQSGANYGWPSTEGNAGPPPTEPGTYQPPLYAYSHGSGTFQGFAITGGAFYEPTIPQFPDSYMEGYFFADYVNGWIHFRDVFGNVSQFASGIAGPVDLCPGSDGSLYYLARDGGQVMRVAYLPPPPSDWQNPRLAEDVDDDGVVAPIDALLVINLINSAGSGLLPRPAQQQTAPPPYYDVNGDDQLAPIDALIVINFLNAHPFSPAGGEGESSTQTAGRGSSAAAVIDRAAVDSWMLASLDETERRERKLR